LRPAASPARSPRFSPKLLNSAPDPVKHGVAAEARGAALAARGRARLDGRLPLAAEVRRHAASRHDEIESMLAQLRRDVPQHKVLLMPEGTTVGALRERGPWLSELCKQRGFRYAHRLQIELYGNKRGT
jgi:7-carboxy-7-deazaguanine synthase